MLSQIIKAGFPLFAFLVFFYQTVPAKVIEQLIVVIDGEPYTLSNLTLYAKTKMNREFPTGNLNKINASDREVLEQFITEKLLESEIREAGIRVTDEEVNRYIDEIKKRNRLSDDELKTALAREGQTLESYRASVKSELEKGEILNRQVTKKVNITNEDVERYYKLNASKFRSDDRVRLWHILFSLSETAPPDQVQEVTEKSMEVYKRIVAGGDFAELAREFSQGAGQAEGGDIGWIKRGTLVAGIEEVAFEKLSVGQVSTPFRTRMGIHIVKLEARENGAALPLSTVAPKIKEELQSKALEERFVRWLKTDLRRKHRVDVRLAGVVFKPEDSKEGMVDSLMARSTRSKRQEGRTFLSYLNPFSYIVKETPFEDEDPKSPMAGKSVVNVFGIPLFTTDTVEEVPDVLAEPPSKSTGEGSSSGQSGGFLDKLNPFSR
ncbi:MAG TPA: peptidylprolyl isomerase [Candidatus Binatia bacterium]|nr:peptidylprolyl isomerase [Candidatus Binatia bacterium]